MAFPKFHLLSSHIPESAPGYQNRNGKRAAICPHLTHLHAQQSEEIGEDEDERNEEKSASCRRYDVGSHRFTDGLHQHVGEHDAGYERKTEHLPSQSHRTYGYNRCIIAEDADDGS